MERHPRFPRLRLFKQPNGRSQNWYCGFHCKGRFVRSSTRTSIWNAALEVAAAWYLERQYELEQGITSRSPDDRFGALSAAMLAQMQADQGETAYFKVLSAYLRPEGRVQQYFGHMKISRVNTRTWDSFRLWLSEARLEQGKQRLSERSFHQLKNAVRLVLRHAYIVGTIDDIPRFIDPLRSTRIDHRPRVFFAPSEYLKLLEATRANILDRSHSRWRDDAAELHDYVVFLVNAGLRVSEAKALRVSHVRLATAKLPVLGVQDVCEVTIVDGKRGAHPPILTFPGAAVAFRRLLSRRRCSTDEPVFLKHHREAFKAILRANELYSDNYGRKRDFVSLRHSHICFRLMSREPIFDIARSTRTSVAMIENHYAKALPAHGGDLNTAVWHAS